MWNEDHAAADDEHRTLKIALRVALASIVVAVIVLLVAPSLIDWNRYKQTFGILAKLPDKIADAYPLEANSPDFHGLHRTLNVLIESMEDWQMKITNFPAWCKKHKRPVPKGE